MKKDNTSGSADEDLPAQVIHTPACNDSAVKEAHQRICDSINKNTAPDVADLKMIELALALDGDGNPVGLSLGLGAYVERAMVSPVNVLSDNKRQIIDFIVAERQRLELQKVEDDRKDALIAAKAQPAKNLEPAYEPKSKLEIRREITNDGITVAEALDAYRERVPNHAEVDGGPDEVVKARFAELRAVSLRKHALKDGQKRVAGANTGLFGM